MISKISDYLSYQLYILNKINKDEITDISFSIELLITHFITFLSIVVLGILVNRFENTVLFLLSFILLRKYSNGYHAATFSGCFILTLLTYFISTIIIPDILFFLQLTNIFYLILVLIVFTFCIIKLLKRNNKLYYLCCLMSFISLIIAVYNINTSITILCVVIIVLVSDKNTSFIN